MTVEELAGTVSHAVKEVFRKMMSLSVADGTCADPEQAELTSVITITGPEGAQGFLGFSVSTRIAESMYKAMLGERQIEPGSDITASVHEVLNIVAGRIAGNVERHKPGAAFSLPSIISSRELKQMCPGNSSVSIIPFRLDEDEFCFTLCM
jgi:CheY-specific phosphatase CheX